MSIIDCKLKMWGFVFALFLHPLGEGGRKWGRCMDSDPCPVFPVPFPGETGWGFVLALFLQPRGEVGRDMLYVLGN